MKLAVTEVTVALADLDVDLAGAPGAPGALAGPPSAALLAATGGRIAGGSSQVQRDIVGERLLGLPRA